MDIFNAAQLARAHLFRSTTHLVDYAGENLNNIKLTKLSKKIICAKMVCLQKKITTDTHDNLTDIIIKIESDKTEIKTNEYNNLLIRITDMERRRKIGAPKLNTSQGLSLRSASSSGNARLVNLTDVFTDLSPGNKAAAPASAAQGLLERCMNSTSHVCSPLKNKVITFVSSIKASVMAFCSRHFGQDAADSAVPAATVYPAPMPTAGAAFTPAAIALLNAMGKIVTDAAQDSGRNAGLFRLSPNSKEYDEFNKSQAAGYEIDLSITSRNVITSHLKNEFNALAPSNETFNKMLALKEKRDGLNSTEEKSVCAKEAIALFKADCQDTDRVSVLLDIFADCYKAAPESEGEYNKSVFHTVIASCLIPGEVPLNEYKKANVDAAGILSMLLSPQI